MSEWITDRRPTEEDADYYKCVWTMCVGTVVLWGYKEIRDGWPWMRTNRPEPYAKPLAAIYNAYGKVTHWAQIQRGEAWMPIVSPKPYVKPKRYAIRCYGDFGLVGPAGYWCVYDTARNVSVSDFMPFEAAERIAATYEEVAP